MDKYKLRQCAKLSSCESCPNKRSCNFIDVIQELIKENFIHIDLVEWRKNRQKNDKH